MAEPPALSTDDVDAALSTWRQGDFSLGVLPFFVGLDPSDFPEGTDKPEGIAILPAEEESSGLVILSQSCDVVRRMSERPYVEVCPLVPVDASVLEQVRRCKRRQYAYVPGAAVSGLVADLDRVLSVSKRVIARLVREPGCATDAEAIAFAQAIVNKRQRFAFPDPFVAALQQMRTRILDKYGKKSPEGNALKALEDIRVTANPSWDAAGYEVTFYFILLDDAGESERAAVSKHVPDWLKLISLPAGVTLGDYLVVHLEDMNAKEYRATVQLDLEQLSVPSK